jgi:hypothetical protein
VRNAASTHPTVGEPRGGCGEQLVPPRERVRRVQEHQVPRAPVRHHADPVGADDDRSAVEAGRAEVRLDDGPRRAIGVGEGHPRGAAREGLDAERAGAGVRVDRPGAIDGARALERVEHRLADPIRRRAGAVTVGSAQQQAARVPGDDAQLAAPSRHQRSPTWGPQRRPAIGSITG